MSHDASGFSWIRSRLESFKCASAGLKDMFRTEHNAKVHALITAAVCVLSWWAGLTVVEWGLVTVAIVMVWLAESLNTVFETLVNIVSPGRSDLAKRAKDIAAAAVLIAVIGATIIGLTVLAPAVWHRLTS